MGPSFSTTSKDCGVLHYLRYLYEAIEKGHFEASQTNKDQPWEDDTLLYITLTSDTAPSHNSLDGDWQLSGEKLFNLEPEMYPLPFI